MTSHSETSGGHEEVPLEQQLFDLFKEAKQVLSAGHERFPGTRIRPELIEGLQGAVGKLAVDSLKALIKGTHYTDLGAVGLDDPAFAELGFKLEDWTEEEQARALHGMAYSAYTRAQNAVVEEMLKEKRVVARKLEGQRAAFSYSDGYFETGGPMPEEVSGVFYSADVGSGTITLAADNPTEEIKFWRVRLLDALESEPTQLAEIQIEDIEMPA